MINDSTDRVQERATTDPWRRSVVVGIVCTAVAVVLAPVVCFLPTLGTLLNIAVLLMTPFIVGVWIIGIISAVYAILVSIEGVMHAKRTQVAGRAATSVLIGTLGVAIMCLYILPLAKMMGLIR